jgi:transmembrane sensor
VLKRHGKPVLPDWVPSPQLSRRALLGGALACSVAAYAAVRPPLELWPSVRDLMADYRTAVGEKRDLTIPGGAELTLNTGTSINVREGGKDDAERVEIVRGEAAVAIDSASDREVVVVAGDGEISARRAQFNVRYEDGSTCVTCLDGDVRVARHAAALTLRKGQQVNYAITGLETPTTVDPVEVAAWRDGLLIFHYRPLTDVVAEINRYRPGRVMVLNSELGRRVVNGRFRVNNLDAIMNMFQQIFGAKLTRLPGEIVLLS